MADTGSGVEVAAGVVVGPDNVGVAVGDAAVVVVAVGAAGGAVEIGGAVGSAAGGGGGGGVGGASWAQVNFGVNKLKPSMVINIMIFIVFFII